MSTFEYTPGVTIPSTYNNESIIKVMNGGSTGSTQIPANAFFSAGTALITTGSVSLTFESNSIITFINTEAFKNCSGLTNVTLPASLTGIGLQVFKDCDLTTLTIEPSGSGSILNAGSIDSQVFSGNDTMTVNLNKATASKINITVPSQSTSFYGSTTAKTVNYPNTFDYILGQTDASTYNGEATILVKNSGAQYQTIGTNAFEGLISPSGPHPPVGSVSLVFESGSDCTSIGSKAFYNCPSLTEAAFPPSLKSIGSKAFSLSSSPPAGQGLSSVTFTDIANSILNTIGGQSFQNQSNLTSIILPKSLQNIWASAFESTGLTTLTFDDIENSKLKLIRNDNPSSQNYSSAFQGTNLSSVILPASLEQIGYNAFSIPTLTSVTFYDIALSRLYIIYAEVFRNAAITTITIPNHIQSIGSDAFFGSNGMTVKMNSKAADTLKVTVPQPSATFFGATGVTIEADENTYEYTPGTSVPTDPPSSLPTSGYGGEPTILVNNSPGTNSIPDAAFLGLITAAYGPAALVFANGSTTKSIGDDAFKNCTGLKHITIPDSITTIGTNAFFGSGLQRVYISRKTAAVLGVTITQNATFYGATGVTIVEYPVVTNSTDIIFPYPKNEKNKRLLGVNQKISSGLARPNFKFQTNQFSAGRSRTAQSKQKANGPYTVIFPIR